MTNDPFSLYPQQMTDLEANTIVREMGTVTSLQLAGVEKTTDGHYVVNAAYNGGKMIYQEPSGRAHWLRPGMAKIGSLQQWRDILAILTKGVSAEF